MSEDPFTRPGVTFRNLDVFGLSSFDDYQHTAASYLLVIPKFFKRLIRQEVTNHTHILHHCRGAVHHGEMLLVLGRPGSGCSTFLKVIAGERLGLNVAPTSIIEYDGFPPTKAGHSLRGSAIYLSELDVHFPELTLGQTLTFAAATQLQTPSSKSDACQTGLQVAAKFKLDAAYKTPVGNAMIRGISGGEKRRTSIAEVFISENPLQCWDNSTRGLDSSTALSVVQSLRNFTSDAQAMAMMSIYQASDDIYTNFDKVMLLYEGSQIYFGSTKLAVDYFLDLGFEKPARATIADFLTSITNPAERRIRDGYSDRVPRSAAEFASAWTMSLMGQALSKSVMVAEDKIRIGYPQAKSNTYKLPTVPQIRLCIHRGFQRLRNHFAPPVAGVVGNTIIAIVVGSVYYNLGEDTASMDRRAVLVFFSLMINAYAPAFDVLTMWAQRPIVEKHHRYAFYRPFTDSIATIVCDLPNKLATAIMFNIPLYFMTNLRRSAGAFFTYLVFITATILTMSMFFRTVGSLSRTVEQSMIPCSAFILIFSAYTGYIIPVKDMVPWLAWIRRINPIAYAFESLMINEFSHRLFPCSQIIPSGVGYNNGDMNSKVCSVIGGAPGHMEVDGSTFIARKYSYHESHMWRNLGIILAIFVILCELHLIATEYIPAQRSRGEILLYRRKSRRSTKIQKDEEGGNLVPNPSPVSPQQLTTFEMVDIKGKDDDRGRDIRMNIQREDAIFHWSNVNYSIPIKKDARQILQNIEGWVRPGSLTALMGVTGAGKTSLLNILAHRTMVGEVTGEIYLGNKVPDANLQRKVGYVQQEDIHLPTATVREALEFSARLRRPNEAISYRQQQIEKTLDLLEMIPYAEAVVGVPGEGLNVEQRKRLSIAVEMVAKPELLLFLDEPSSGLDSQTAWSICTLLRKLANSGQAILVTIHQPSSQLFELFDRLLLLDSRGRVTYFGEIGTDAETVIRYFKRNGAGQCDSGKNPAEWVLSVASHSEKSETAANEEKGSWHQIWAESTERQDVLRQIALFKEHTVGGQEIGDSLKQRRYAASFPAQLSAVTQRIFQEYWRNPVYLYCKLALCVVTTLLNSISFYNARLDIQGISNIFFSVFLFTQLFSTIDQQVIPRLIDGRSLFEARERRSRTYSWTVFVCANVVVELFWQTIASVLVFATWYYPTGLYRNHDPGFPPAERSGLTFCVIWLFNLWVSTFSQAVGVGIDHAETAVQIATLFFWLSLVFCGVLVAPDDLPRFWHFVYRASPLTYFIDGMVIAGLANTKIQCSHVEMLRINPPVGQTCAEYLGAWIEVAGGYLKNPSAKGDECSYCPVAETNTLLKNMGIDVESRWNNFGYLTVYVTFNVLATFAIYWVARGRR